MGLMHLFIARKIFLLSSLPAIVFSQSLFSNSVEEILAKLDEPSQNKVSLKVKDKYARFSNGRISYVLNGLEKTPAKGYHLGMSEPEKCNFYCGGFMRFSFGKIDSTMFSPPAFKKILDSQNTSVLEVLWKNDGVIVKDLVTLLPDSEFLIMDLSIESGSERTDTKTWVSLKTYPQSFSRGFTSRNNFCLNSKNEFIIASKEPVNKYFKEQDIKWIYIGDMKCVSGNGGIAVGFIPENLENIRVILGGYSSRIDLTFKDSGKALFFLMDLAKRDVADATLTVPNFLNKEYQHVIDYLNKSPKGEILKQQNGKSINGKK